MKNPSQLAGKCQVFLAGQAVIDDFTSHSFSVPIDTQDMKAVAGAAVATSNDRPRAAPKAGAEWVCCLLQA